MMTFAVTNKKDFQFGEIIQFVVNITCDKPNDIFSDYKFDMALTTLFRDGSLQVKK